LRISSRSLPLPAMYPIGSLVDWLPSVLQLAKEQPRGAAQEGHGNSPCLNVDSAWARRVLAISAARAPGATGFYSDVATDHKGP
jgi:hypothetical protein